MHIQGTMPLRFRLEIDCLLDQHGAIVRANIDYGRTLIRISRMVLVRRIIDENA
jgi:hypothetical protein